MKPDYKLSDKVIAIMEKEALTPADVSKETKVSYQTVVDYISKKPVKKWRDSAVRRIATFVNHHELAYAEEKRKLQGEKLQKEAERNSKEKRKETFYTRAKVVHAILQSPLLDDNEKQEYIAQFME